MTKKIILLSILLITGYFFYNPLIIPIAEVGSPKSIHFKPGQIFTLKDIPGLKDSQNTMVYIVSDGEERKNLSPTIPKWKILQSDNPLFIKDLLHCRFKYTGSDVSTIQSKMYVYANNTLVFESEISLDKNSPGLQNRTTGWITPVDHNQFLKSISQFERYNLPRIK